MAQILDSFDDIINFSHPKLNKYMGLPEAEYFDDAEKVIKWLECLCEVPPDEEEETACKILFKKSETEKYLAYPVLLALILEEYELANRLLDAGYPINDALFESNEQALGICDDGTEWRFKDIFATQLLVGKENMPKALFKRVCDEVGIILPAFSFMRDYWENPFIPEMHQFKRDGLHIPSMRGLDRVYEYRPELLEGFISRPQMVKLGYGLQRLKYGKKQKIVWKLLEYSQGYEEDFKALLALFEFEFSDSDRAKRTGHNIKLLFWIQELCKCSHTMQRVLFEFLMVQLHNTIESRSYIKKEDYREFCGELVRLAHDCKPQDYDFEDYLDSFMIEESYWTEYGKYVQLWKKVTEDPMKVSRMNGTFGDMIQEVIGKVYEDDESLLVINAADNREKDREKRVQTLIELMEQPIIFTDSFKKTKSQKEAVAVLFSAILDFGSEELVIACMKNGILPKELMPKLISAAIGLKRFKVVPAMIVHQNLKS